MGLKDLFRNLGNVLDRNAPEILTGTAIVSLGVTIILVANESIKVNDSLNKTKTKLEKEDDENKRKEIKIDCAKEIAKICWPGAMSAVITGGCIIFSNRISTGKQKKLATMAGMAQASLLDCKSNVRNLLNDKQTEEFDCECAKEQLDAAEYVTHTGLGEDLCCESITGQVFYCDIDYILRRWHSMDDQMRMGDDVALNDWLYELNLEKSVIGDDHVWRYDLDRGWDTVGIVKRSILYKGRPCFYICYDRPPIVINHA